MDEGLARWLSLREAADAASRSESLTRRVMETLPAGPVSVVDLGTGTGSNIRYLMPRLARAQQWLAVDRSATLLAQLDRQLAATRPADVQIEIRQANLGTIDQPALFAGRHLVTASALLDLVSPGWLRALAAQCRAAGAAVLFAITYNGLSSSDPAEPEDGLVLELFNRHQRTDKGLGGVAAGPDAPGAAERAFAAEGFAVVRARSDWVLEPALADMQRMLIDGWAAAAAEIAPDQRARIAGWHGRRLAHVDAGRSRIVVGHDDLAAWMTRSAP